MIAVGHLKQGGEVFGGEPRIAQAAINGGKQAPHHRHQVGGELQLDWPARGPTGQQFNLGGVAMAHHPVGGHGLRRFRQQQMLLGGAPAPRRARFCIDHDALAFDQTLLEKRHQGQQAGGGETAGGPHQAGRGQLVSGPFHQPVHRLGAESFVRAVLLPGFSAVGGGPLGKAGEAIVGG